MEQQTCEARVAEHLSNRIDDLQDMWGRMHVEDENDRETAFQEFDEYGLCFDYVPADEKNEDFDHGFFRYQLSWGGPGDEFRFFVDHEYRTYRIEYWFLDWFDGAHRVLHGDHQKFLDEIWDTHFRDVAETIFEREEER
jgi:hypothetical protein